MKIIQVKNSFNDIVDGPAIIEPKIFNDIRGCFFESWNQEKFNNSIGEKIIFVQDNHSNSKRGVLRGLHYQLMPKPQGKLVRVTSGMIFDTLVDLRESSKTYGTWCGIYLNSREKKLLWVPAGFAHGFLTLSETADVQYKVTNYWDMDLEQTLKWNDIDIKINWPLDKAEINKPITSIKDGSAQSLKEIERDRKLMI